MSSPESSGFSTCRRVEDGSDAMRRTRSAVSITRVGSSSPWRTARGKLTLGETFGLAGADAGDAAFSVDAQAIVTRVRCVNCGSVREVGGRLLGRLLLAACRRCGGVMMPAATDACDELSRSAADPGWLERPLAAFGVVDGDVDLAASAGLNDALRVGPLVDGGRSEWIRYSGAGSRASSRRQRSSRRTATSRTLCPGTGAPPQDYLARFESPTLVQEGGAITQRTGFEVLVHFPPDYLRSVPTPCAWWLS